MKITAVVQVFWPFGSGKATPPTEEGVEYTTPPSLIGCTPPDVRPQYAFRGHPIHYTAPEDDR